MVNHYCTHSFARNWQLSLNQWKGENDHRKYFITNLHERLLLTLQGSNLNVLSTYSMMHIQLSHWFFFSLFGFYGLFKKISLISSWSFIKGGRKLENLRKTTWPSVCRNWLPNMWIERGWNRSSEKPNGLRVRSYPLGYRGPPETPRPAYLSRQSSNAHNCKIWFTSLHWLWRKMQFNHLPLSLRVLSVAMQPNQEAGHHNFSYN